MTIPLKNAPKKIHTLIIKEQARITIEEDSKLKMEYVVYRMLEEWKTMKIKKV